MKPALLSRRALLRHGLIASSVLALPARAAPDLRKLERSYWLHASLGAVTQYGYWGREFPRAAPPTRDDVRNAARLLTGPYAANRLYLMHHQELPPGEVLSVFRWWREACPKAVDLVPTFVLRMYDKAQSPVFAPEELRAFCRELKDLRVDRVAVYDIYPNRDQGACLPVLEQEFKGGVLRVGLQPGEKLAAPYLGAVEDTWSAFCHGKTNEDWTSPGFGRDTLRTWIEERNAGAAPIAWDLIVVAWDYAVTKRGEYPGYDDAEKNMPLPEGRNRLAVHEILRLADPKRLAGLSSDLFILQVNSAGKAHDGPTRAFYQSLRSGKPYAGYYAAPLNEIAALYHQLRDSK